MQEKSRPGPDVPGGLDAGSPKTVAVTILDFLSVIVSYRRFISWFVLGISVVVTVVALIMPKWYRSTASVFPAEKADLLGGLEGIASVARAFAPSRALSALGGNAEADRYMAILKSGTVLQAVIEKFDLVHVYEITSYPGEKTVKELLSNLEITLEQEGNITISVYDRDPQRAADMANFFVEMLNKTNTELMVQNARGNRQFIEDRYNKNLADLAAAEDSLKAFQKRYGVIAMPEQTEASIKAMAEIYAQMTLKDIEANVLRRTQSAESPAVMSAEIQVEEIKRKIAELNSGGGGSATQMSVFVPFSKIPDLGSEYIRRYRDMEIQYKILQFITPLYEQAKVEERRQTPSVVVLDRAAPAERKAKPKVMLYALTAFLVSLLLSVAGAFAAQWIRNLRQAQPGRVEEMIDASRKDWLGLRITRRQR